MIVPLRFVPPNSTRAVIADCCVLFKTVLAQGLSVVIIRLVIGQDSSADGADFRFVHGKISFLFWFMLVCNHQDNI